MVDPDTPDSETLCDFTELTDDESDQGRAFSAPIVQSCAAPDVDVTGAASIVYVNGEPTAVDA